MTDLFTSGLGYSGINTARCALSSFLNFDQNINIGSHVLVKRFMRGIFVLKPSLPRYAVTWNVNTVLDYLENQYPLESLSLLELSQKLVMLLALLSGQRGQTLHLLDIRNVYITDDSVKILIGDLLKTSKPNKHLGELNFASFPHNDSLCIVNILRIYMAKTQSLRGDNTGLFITTQLPYRRVSRDTISRWTRTVLKNAGIDIQMFKPHSTRAASVSAAKLRDVSLNTILKTVGWNQECTFRKFYNKPVVVDKTFCAKMLQKYM